MSQGYSIFAGTMVDMTYPAVQAAADRGAGVLLPVGVVEAHGPHLPLGTDIYGSVQMCRLVQDQLAAGGVEALIAPPFYWGINHVLSAFPGTFRTRPEVVAGLLEDILETLAAGGFAKICLINHHGDLAHNRLLDEAVLEQHRRGRRSVRWAEGPGMKAFARLGYTGREAHLLAVSEEVPLTDLVFSEVLGVHAHETETALIDHYFPDLVDRAVLASLEPTSLTRSDLEEWRKGGEHARRVTPLGYFGAPKPVDPDLWRYYKLHACGMAAAVRQAWHPGRG